jgi:hypothetical protein
VSQTTSKQAVSEVADTPSSGEQKRDELDEQLVRQLAEHARAQGTSLVGPDGLLGKLTKLVFETGLEAELSEHLGYEPHEALGRNSGNSRNGARSKKVITDPGPVELDVPRDRNGISRAVGHPPGSIFTIVKQTGGYVPKPRRRRAEHC